MHDGANHFCESLGFKTNLEIFRNPEKSNFYEQDFDVYLGLTDMESIPKYRCERKVIDDFCIALRLRKRYSLILFRIFDLLGLYSA